MKLKILTVILISIVGCSTLTKNIVKTSPFALSGGVVRDLSWDGPLNFEHVSWYNELTLVFDLLITRMDKKSDFSNWLSNNEKKYFTECRDFRIALTYSLDTEKISKAMFLDQAAKAGYEEVSLNTFSGHLKNHPDFNRFSLRLYNIFGLCKKSGVESSEKLKIDFPGFQTTPVN